MAVTVNGKDKLENQASAVCRITVIFVTDDRTGRAKLLIWFFRKRENEAIGLFHGQDLRARNSMLPFIPVTGTVRSFYGVYPLQEFQMEMIRLFYGWTQMEMWFRWF
ncbi:hypothetical protein AALB39_15280 [Lachnospiraceae bacterium 54-53]